MIHHLSIFFFKCSTWTRRRERNGFLDSEIFDIIWPKLKAHYVMMIFSIVRLRIAFSSISFTRFFPSSISVSNKQKGDGNVINSKHNGRSIKTTDIQCVGGVLQSEMARLFARVWRRKKQFGCGILFLWRCVYSNTHQFNYNILLYTLYYFNHSVCRSLPLSLMYNFFFLFSTMPI